MMRFCKTDKGNVINIDGEYVLVNDFTLQLLDMYFQDKTIEEIATILGKKENEIQKYYTEISDLLMNTSMLNKDIEFIEPLKVQWKITEECNLKCKHCYEGEKKHMCLSKQDISKIFDVLINSQILSLTITGGEALLVDELAYHVSKCLENGIAVNVFTNGLLLDKFIDKMDKKEIVDLLSIEVSIDGDEKEHDFIRGEGTFRKTLTNIKYALDNGYNIITNTVINKKNSCSIIPMMKKLNRLGVTTIQLSNLMMKGWAVENKNSLYMSRKEIQELYQKIEENINFDFYYADISDDTYLKKEGLPKKYLGKNTWQCCAGTARITINFDGEVLLCPSLPQYSIGNILKDDFYKIWNNPLRKEYIKKIKALNRDKKVCFIYDEFC